MAKRGDCCWRQEEPRAVSSPDTLCWAPGRSSDSPRIRQNPRGHCILCQHLTETARAWRTGAFHSVAPTRDASFNSQHPAEQRGRRVRTGLCRPRGAAELKLALGLHLGLWHMAQPDELRAPGSACAITPSLPSLPRGSATRLPQPGPAAALWGRPRASSARAGAVPLPSALPLDAAPRQHGAASTAPRHWELSQHPWVIRREHGKG